MGPLPYSGKVLRPFVTPQIWLTALGFALIAIALAPIIAARGVPAFEQDWQWPVHHAQCAPFMRFGSEPWNSGGIGSAQSYPEPWLPYLLGGGLCEAVGPHWGLIAYLAILLGLAALAMSWLVKQYAFSIAGRAAAIAMYLGNPVLLNELHAGHLHFIFSYAFLPSFLAAILDRRTRNHWLLLGVLLGLASAQQQFFAFGLLLGLALAFGLERSWMLRAGLPALLVAITFTSSQWILAFVATANYNAYPPLTHWEESQSVPFSTALRFLGYIGHYDAVLPRWLQSALWIFPMLAFIGAIVAFVRKRARRWAVAALIALLLVNGLYGPFAFPLQAGIEHVQVLAVFRELYNLEAVAIIAFAILAAIAIDAVARHSIVQRLSGVIVAPVVLISGAISFYAAAKLPMYAVGLTGSALIDRIAASPGTGRYLSVPSAMPQSLDNLSVTGLSPFTLPIENHAAAIAAVYETPYSAIAANNDKNIPSSLLSRMGVSAILKIPGIRQATNYEPQLRGIFPPLSVNPQPRWQLLQKTNARLTVLHSTTVLEFMDRGRLADLNDAVRGVNPRFGWVHVALWNNLPSWLYDRPAGIFTLERSARLSVTANTTLLAGSSLGDVSASDCALEKRLDLHYSILRCTGGTTIRGTPPLAVSEAVADGDNRFVQVKPATVSQLSIIGERRSSFDVNVNAASGAVLFLSERYDPGWQCIGCGAVHVRADGFANAWLLRKRIHRTIRIIFQPAVLYYITLWLSIVLATAALVDAILTAKPILIPIDPVAENIDAGSGSRTRLPTKGSFRATNP